MSRFACFVLVGALIGIAGCEKRASNEPAPRVVEQEPKIEAVKVVLKNFDASQKRLASGFAGDSPWLLVDFFGGLDLRKGQFEKTEEFKSRMAEIGRANVKDSLMLDGYFAFVLENKAFYNPDKEAATFTIYNDNSLARKALLTSDDSTMCGISSIKGWYDYYRERHFQKIKPWESVDLVEHRLDRYSPYGGTGTVKVPIDKAKSAGNALQILVVGKFLQPFYVAKCDLPSSYDYESLTLQHKFYFEIDSVWVFDRSTGEVFGKVPYRALSIRRG